MNALTVQTTTWTLKSGTNKGQRRIWIEGTRLSALGLTRGTLLRRAMFTDHSSGRGLNSIFLTTVSHAEFAGLGGRERCRVAGTVDRPIIDLSGKWVTAFMGSAQRFVVVTMTFEAGNCATATVAGLRITPLP